MPCLPSAVAAEELLFKNELAIKFAFNFLSTDAKRPSPELPAVVTALQSSRKLDRWIVKPDAGNEKALATIGTDRMVYLKVSTPIHRSVPGKSSSSFRRLSLPTRTSLRLRPLRLRRTSG